MSQTHTETRRAGEDTFKVPANGLQAGDVSVKIGGVAKTVTTDYTILPGANGIKLVTPLGADAVVEITFNDRRIIRGDNVIQPAATPAIVSYTQGSRTVAGTSVPGSIVQVSVDGAAQAGFAVTDGKGDWSFVLPGGVANGAHQLTAAAVRAVFSRPTPNFAATVT